MQPLWRSPLKSGGQESLGRVRRAGGAGDGDTRGDGTGGGGVFSTAGGGGLATNCVSYCSCVVRAARVELMLLSEICCLSVSSCRWCCRYPKALATPWGVSKGNDIWRGDFLEGCVWQGRVTYWVAIHWDSPRLCFKILICCKNDWAQDSRRILSNITACGYDTTHLQKNPQRLGWGFWRDPLHYIHPLVSGLAGLELN